jgi:hypothetical protein
LIFRTGEGSLPGSFDVSCGIFPFKAAPSLWREHMLFRVFETGSLIALAMGFLSGVMQEPVNNQPLKVGDTAPDFALKNQDNKAVKLSDFRGRENVVLAFFPLAFTSG